MKKIISLVLLATFITTSTFAQPSKLYSGKNVEVRITSDVSSKKRDHDQTIIAIVDKDVRNEQGQTLIRRGTPVKLGTTISRAKGMGKEGFIKIECISTTAVDGQEISLMGGDNFAGKNRLGAALGCGLGLGLTVLFPVGFFFFCIKGENATIPAHTLLQNVLVNDTYTISVE